MCSFILFLFSPQHAGIPKQYCHSDFITLSGGGLKKYSSVKNISLPENAINGSASVRAIVSGQWSIYHLLFYHTQLNEVLVLGVVFSAQEIYWAALLTSWRSWLSCRLAAASRTWFWWRRVYLSASIWRLWTKSTKTWWSVLPVSC